jgi:hypothetical protein
MLGWKNQTTNNNNTQLDKHITMSLPNQIIVSGAGNTAFNGTYTKTTDTGLSATWEKSSDSNFNLILSSQFDPGNFDEGDYGWFFKLRNITIEDSDDAYVSESVIGGNQTFTESDFSRFNIVSNGGEYATAPAPTITFVAAAPATVTSFKVAEGAKVKLQGKVKVV